MLHESAELKYAFIERHRRVWPTSVQCRVLRASMAGYREHFVRRASAAQRRHLSDDALLVHIKAIHAETSGGYGWPRTWKELLARGIRVGKERVRKLMQLHGQGASDAGFPIDDGSRRGMMKRPARAKATIGSIAIARVRRAPCRPARSGRASRRCRH